MDDLIIRKAAIDRLNAIPPGNWSKARYTRELWNVSSVGAVPLDKLCIWLENNASMYYGTNVSRHAWKQMITSDLMEENTNDAE